MHEDSSGGGRVLRMTRGAKRSDDAEAREAGCAPPRSDVCNGHVHLFATAEMTVREERTGRILRRLVPVPGGYRDVHRPGQEGT